MTITAELADGRRLEFPDGTSQEIIQATVKKVVSGEIGGERDVAIPTGAERDALERQQLLESAPDDDAGNDMAAILASMVTGGRDRTAAAVVDPRVTDTDPDFSFLDVALPVAGGAVGAIGGSALGPLGTAGGGALGAGAGQALADLMADGEVDLGDAAVSALLGGLVPGAGTAVRAGAGPAARIAREFAPDVAGAAMGASAGSAALPVAGTFGGAAFGARAGRELFGRSGTIAQRSMKAIRGKRKGSPSRSQMSRQTEDVASNAERESRLRRALLGIEP